MKSILIKFLKYLLGLLGENENQVNFRGKFMYIVKTDHADVNFGISFEAFDSEGNPVEETGLTVEVVSDNPDAVAITFDPATMAGSATFGSPGLANVNATVSNGDVLLGSFGAQFTVTVGDPASINAGTIAFEGLSEA